MFLLIDRLLVISYSTLRASFFQVNYVWKSVEKLLNHTVHTAIQTFSVTLASVTPSFVTIPNHWFQTAYNLKNTLFFEYTHYTPFLKTSSNNSINPKTSVKVERFWLKGEGDLATRRKANVELLSKMNWSRSASMLYWIATPTYFFDNLFHNPTITFSSFYTRVLFLRSLFAQVFSLFRRTLGEGAFYLKGMAIVFFIDACLTDDEPLWEPIEWSLVQSWILFIFLFAWIGENLITSAYGSYTGRDKRVWFAWYKTFWLVEAWYALSLGLAALFVITPFYHELTYSTPFIVSWWTWYSRVFFCKFVTIYSLTLYVSYFLQINIRFFNWRKLLLCTVVINLFLSYLLYIHFFMSFFGYLTNPNWYLKNRLVDYIQLSHEPNRWGWGVTKPVKRDHFLQHRSTSLIWFKNDGPFASAFLFIHVYFFLCLFTLYLFWITLMRRAYATREFTYTFTTFCVSALKQFFYFFFFLYILVFMSFIINYWRAPIENHWLFYTDSWFWSTLGIYRNFAHWAITNLLS